MSNWRELLTAAACWIAFATPAQAQTQAQAQTAAYPGVGRAATPKEVAAWDIDVRPDFKGLPQGSGTVAKGMQVWEAKCASCHGVFGESNEVFSPIVGGTSKEDIKAGHVARLNDRSFPGRTTLMKLSSLSTLWDYINRAMPWAQPKSLTIEEVYSVTAYILNLGDILPDNFTLSDRNIAEVQKLLPNRNGMSTDHALWPSAGAAKRRPDVAAAACMKDCGPAPMVASFLPDFARDAHGNLAEQNRSVGAQVGADTTKPAAAARRPGGGAPGAVLAAAPPVAAAEAAKPLSKPEAKSAAESGGAAAVALLGKHACVACHGIENKVIGPSFREIAKKHVGRADSVGYLAGKIKAGGSGVWGTIPMPPQALAEADAKAIAQWLADGAKK